MNSILSLNRIAKRSVCYLLFSSVLVCASVSLALGQSYTVTKVGPLPGGSYSEAVSINESGQVVGNASTPGSSFSNRGFLFSDDVLTELGTFGGNFSLAHEINEAGQIVGQASIPGDIYQRAFIWLNGTMTDLGTLPGEKNYSVGYGINDSGKVVGDSKTEGMIYENGEMTGLSRRSARLAYRVNSSGHLVGILQNDHAFFFDGDRMKDLAGC